MSDKTILLIEDDEDIQGLWKLSFQGKLPPHTLKIAANFEDGVRMANDDKSIVAIITDNKMPRSAVDGFTDPHAADVCTQVRMIPHHATTPIFVVSSHIDPAHCTLIEQTKAIISPKKDKDAMDAVAEQLRTTLAPSRLPPDHRDPGTRDPNATRESP